MRQDSGTAGQRDSVLQLPIIVELKSLLFFCHSETSTQHSKWTELVRRSDALNRRSKCVRFTASVNQIYFVSRLYTVEVNETQ